MDFKLELKGAKKPVYPTKTHINLVDCNQVESNVGRNLILFAVAMLIVVLFGKFAVADVLAMGTAASARVEAAQAELAQLEQQNADYDELEKEYEAYAVNSLSDEELSLVDRGKILTLLQNTVANAADLQSVSIQGNVVVLQFANSSLEDVSHVVAALEGDSLVDSVSVSTAQTDRDDAVVSTATITLSSGERSDA